MQIANSIWRMFKLISDLRLLISGLCALPLALSLVGALLFAICVSAEAQQPKKVPRIGLLSVGADPAKPVVWFPFLEKMRELAYVEDQNIVFERRFGEGRRERLPELIADLVIAKVDIVVTGESGQSHQIAGSMEQGAWSWSTRAQGEDL